MLLMTTILITMDAIELSPSSGDLEHSWRA
jgi:hypothetical protein